MSQTIDRDPTGLTPHERKRMRARLVSDREDVQTQVAGITLDIDAFRLSQRDTSTDDEHDPEGPTIAFERSQANAVLGQAKGHLAQVESAIIRLDEGSFGLCARCHQAIPFARLEARPYAVHCVPCAERLGR